MIFFLSKNRSHQPEQTKLSQNDKNAIIEEALSVELPPTDTTVSEEANRFSKEATKKVGESNYEEAISITVDGLKKFPKNFTLQSDLASLVGDCSYITPSPLKERMIEKSKALFDRLKKEVHGQPKAALYAFENEYYFRFALYHDQYELGTRQVNDYWRTKEWVPHGIKGYYRKGVGATYYAKELLKQGNKKRALEYAQKALVAWAQYFSYENDYYNPYVHYALALGMLGYKEDIDASFRTKCCAY